MFLKDTIKTMELILQLKRLRDKVLKVKYSDSFRKIYGITIE